MPANTNMTTNGSLRLSRLRFQYNEIHICVQSGPLPPRPMSGDFFNIRHEIYTLITSTHRCNASFMPDVKKIATHWVMRERT